MCIVLYIYICHRHGKGFRKETTRFGLSIIFGIFSMDAGRYADKLWWSLMCMHSSFPAKNIRADDCDIII